MNDITNKILKEISERNEESENRVAWLDTQHEKALARPTQVQSRISWTGSAISVKGHSLSLN